ncbi:MAG TPA: tetratricopeptide repeat protein [Terracidiphilus sp.]|jgi:DNA-binding winged helix-turn-helix (wHTH) protein/tetratricopeptide (TPR) repeat protein|nr:tetratricopeptide repeat protein [Terracidiphilus sp.]
MDDTNQKTTRPSAAAFRFGLFALDVSAGTLTRNGLRIKLQEQPFQLLTLLVERAGEVVTREEIRQRLWPGNTFVDFDKSLGVAILKVREALADSASNPTFLETVPRRGYRFIAPVSAGAFSSGAFPSSAAVAASAAQADAPSAESISHQPKSPQPNSSQPSFPRSGTFPSEVSLLAEVQFSKARRQALWLSAGAICVVAATAFLVFRLGFDSHRAAPSAQATQVQLKVRRSVAVLGFRNVAGEPEQNWLSTAFTEMLNTELAANGDLRLVSGEDVANVKHDLSLPAGDTLAKNTLARLRSNLGADVVVTGSYTLLSDGGKNRLRLDIRAQDTALGETVYEDAITGNENDLFNLASQAGSRLRQGLNPSLASDSKQDTPRFSGSKNQLAIQLYSEGRSRLFEFDYIGARDFLKRAVTADPDFALAHSALARAWSGLGYEAQERSEAKRALQLAQNLPQETALAIQGQYQQSVNDWQGAESTYRKLFGLFPDNLAYGLQLADAQLRPNPAGALQTLTALRMLPAPVGSDPRIDLMEASVLIGQNLPKARAAAQHAIEKASAEGATLMMARGYGILCQQSSSIGVSMDQSVVECDLARNSYLSAGDQNNAARTLNDLAGIYFSRSDVDRAESMWREAIEVFRKVGDTQGIAAASNNVGDVLLTRGKLAQAEELLQQALAADRLIGDLSGAALAMADLGEIALQRADLPNAKRNFEQALANSTKIGDKSAAAYGLSGLGDVFMEQDQLAAARGQHEMALRLRSDIGEKETILQSRVALAKLAIEEGHAKDAESEARRCRDELHREQFLDDELGTGLVLVSAMLDQSKDTDAKREVLALRPLEEKTQDRELQLRYSLELAQTLAAEHDLGSSQTLLDTVSREATASGFAGLAWEAQTALASVQGSAGDRIGAIKQLKILQARAQNAGLQLRARKADAAATLLADPGK